MSSPCVSIIVPVFNRGRLLEQALSSVVQQTCDFWECVVVDDRSTEEEVASVRSRWSAETRIRFLDREGPRGGANVCRNQGFSASKGEYVIFLDSDDALAPHCVEGRLEAIEACPELDFIVSLCRLFFEEPGDSEFFWNVATSEDDLDRWLRFDAPWHTGSPIWRRSALEAIGGWDESLPSWQDWDLHVRALKTGLRYRWRSDADCFWRLAQQQSIHQVSMRSPDHLRSHRLLFDRTRALFASELQTSMKRKWQIVGLYFWLAELWMLKRKPWTAVDIWLHCYRVNLIDRRVLLHGIAYFAAGKVIPKRTREELRQSLWCRWTGSPYAVGILRTQFKVSIASQRR